MIIGLLYLSIILLQYLWPCDCKAWYTHMIDFTEKGYCRAMNFHWNLVWNLGSFYELQWNWKKQWHSSSYFTDFVVHVCLHIKINLRYSNLSLDCKSFLTKHKCLFTVFTPWTALENEFIWKSSPRVSPVVNSFKWIHFQDWCDEKINFYCIL